MPGSTVQRIKCEIVWTDEAIGNLEAIVAYISAFNTVAAERLGAKLIEVAVSLAEFSERGRDACDDRMGDDDRFGPMCCGIVGRLIV